MASYTAQTNADGGGQALVKSARTPSGDDRPFAIMRYAKLKSTGSIRGSSKHMARSIPTPNADASISANNPILIGSDDPAADVLALVPEIGERNDDGQLLRRSNSVLAVEVLMTASPEWWRESTREDRDEWVARSRAWLIDEWGAANVAHARFHIDETTPHITGMIVPRDPETGVLNARRWIGGKSSKLEPGTSRISGHQTRYAAAVEDLGLRRGLIGSTATHQSVAEYYRRVNASDDLELPEIPTPPLYGRKKWAEELRAQVHDAIKIKAAKAAELPVQRRKAIEAARTADNNAQALTEAREARQALAAQMRELPLDGVLTALGLAVHPEDEQKKPDQQRWVAGPKGNRTHRIEISGRKWRCAAQQTGGGGAIDLAKNVLETDFNGALAWLSDRFGTDATSAEIVAGFAQAAGPRVAAAVAERPAFTPPSPAPEAWPAVRRHLIEDRALEPDLVDAAHEAGDLYAQTRTGPHGGELINAIFMQRDVDGTPTGAEIKGIATLRDGSRFSAVAPGSDKKRGAFRAGLRQIGDALRVVVVESAIDALSALGLLRSRFDVATTSIVSTSGDGSVPAPILDAVKPGAKRFAGQDHNDAGDAQAAALGDGWTRMPPQAPYEDWNDVAVALKSTRTGSGGDPWADATPTETSIPTEPDPDPAP